MQSISRREVSRAPQHPPDLSKLSNDQRQLLLWANRAGHSKSFERLGRLEHIKSLQLAVDRGNISGAIEFAKEARASFTKAIEINPLNHSAYASRAGVSSRLCHTR